MKKRFIVLWILFYVIWIIRISNGQETPIERDALQEGFKNLNELNVMITIIGDEKDKKFIHISEDRIRDYVIKELNYRIPILEVNQFSENKLHLDINIVNYETASIKIDFIRNKLGSIWLYSKNIYKPVSFLVISDF